MPAYFAVFVAGDRIRIKPVEFLRTRMVPSWEFHHPLDKNQLAFAGEETSITHVSYWHGGDVLLELRDIPGIWHEDCVEDPLLDDVLWEGYPAPLEYFVFQKIVRDGVEFIQVTSSDGCELMRRFSHAADGEIENMREVARLRHFEGFTERFQITTPFQLSRQEHQRNIERWFRRHFDLTDNEVIPNARLTEVVLGVLKDGIPSYSFRDSRAKHYFVAAQWSLWEREVSNPVDLPEDQQIRALCQFYVGATPRQRQFIREMDKWNSSLLHFAHRSAVRALRTGNHKEIQMGLIALSMNDQGDRLPGGQQWAWFKGNASRCILEMLSRVAAKIGADLPGMIEQAVVISTPYTAKLLRHATAEPTREFEIEEYDDDNGRMIGWPAWPK